MPLAMTLGRALQLRPVARISDRFVKTAGSKITAMMAVARYVSFVEIDASGREGTRKTWRED